MNKEEEQNLANRVVNGEYQNKRIVPKRMWAYSDFKWLLYLKVICTIALFGAYVAFNFNKMPGQMLALTALALFIICLLLRLTIRYRTEAAIRHGKIDHPDSLNPITGYENSRIDLSNYEWAQAKGCSIDYADALVKWNKRYDMARIKQLDPDLFNLMMLGAMLMHGQEIENILKQYIDVVPKTGDGSDWVFDHKQIRSRCLDVLDVSLQNIHAAIKSE